MATLDATALSATLLLSALALLLSALAISALNLKSKQNCPHITCLCWLWCVRRVFFLSLDLTQSMEMHYKMQHNYYLTGFHKWTNTLSQGSVSILMTLVLVHKKEFLYLNSLKDFWRSLAEISKVWLFNNSNHLKDLVICILWTLVMSFSDAQVIILTVILISLCCHYISKIHFKPYKFS